MRYALVSESARKLGQFLVKGPFGEGSGFQLPASRFACIIRVTGNPSSTWFETNAGSDPSGDYKGVVTHRIAGGDTWIDVSSNVRVSSLAGALTSGQRYLCLRTGSLQVYGTEGSEGWPRFLALAPADEVDGTAFEGLVSNGTQHWNGDKIFRNHITIQPSDLEPPGSIDSFVDADSNYAATTIYSSTNVGGYCIVSLCGPTDGDFLQLKVQFGGGAIEFGSNGATLGCYDGGNIVSNVPIAAVGDIIEGSPIGFIGGWFAVCTDGETIVRGVSTTITVSNTVDGTVYSNNLQFIGGILTQVT